MKMNKIKEKCEEMYELKLKDMDKPLFNNKKI